MLYVENLAEFLYLLIESQKSGVFLPQNASCVTTAQMVAAIATAKGKNVHLCNWMNPFVALAKNAGEDRRYGRKGIRFYGD